MSLRHLYLDLCSLGVYPDIIPSSSPVHFIHSPSIILYIGNRRPYKKIPKTFTFQSDELCSFMIKSKGRYYGYKCLIKRKVHSKYVRIEKIYYIHDPMRPFRPNGKPSLTYIIIDRYRPVVFYIRNEYITFRGYHNSHGPAIIELTNVKHNKGVNRIVYYENNLIHRSDGPAIIEIKPSRPIEPNESLLGYFNDPVNKYKEEYYTHGVKQQSFISKLLEMF